MAASAWNMSEPKEWKNPRHAEGLIKISSSAELSSTTLSKTTPLVRRGANDSFLSPRKC